MAAGRSNPAIGEVLFLSVSAVEKHISAIFTKLGLVEEPSIRRRVAAVLAYLADGDGVTSRGRDQGVTGRSRGFPSTSTSTRSSKKATMSCTRAASWSGCW